MEIKEQLKKIIQEALAELGFDKVEPQIEYPTDSPHGDYSSNIALVLSKKAKQPPMVIADKIAQNLKSQVSNLKYLDRIEVAPPGFINFWLSKDYLVKQLGEALKIPQHDKKIMVEYAHPNTHKLFHIGHLRNISIGESIVRLFEAIGHKVVRANYQGDVGMHIAKVIYTLLHIDGFKDEVSKIKEIDKRVEFLGKAYVAGNKAFDNDEKAKQIIKDINYLVYASAQRFQKEKGLEPSSTDYMKFVKGRREEVDKVFELWKETRQWSLDYFEEIYKRVYTHYDRYYFESECLLGIDLTREAVKKGVLKEDKGAIIFDGKPYGLDTRVFVNSLGLPTYEAKELALAEKEFSEFGELARAVHVVGPEQTSFFKITFKVEELLNPKKYKGKQLHLVYGWVRFKHGKMSSRTGQVVLGEWLLDEAKTRIKKQFPEMNEKIAEIVAVGAVKYSILKFSIPSSVNFSFEESISLEGNSGPYLQYTYARTQSVLAKAISPPKAEQLATSKLEVEEVQLLRHIHRFPEIVEEAAQQFAPNVICSYLYELASKFNLFYQKHKIIQSERQNFRLALTAKVGQILQTGLYLLGIEAPERM